MSVKAAFAYKDGQRTREVSLDAPDTLTPHPGEFVWIGLLNASPHEMSILRKAFDLHPLAVEDALKADQLPKAEVYGEKLFVLAKTAQIVDGAISYGQTSVFVGPNFIVTARQGSDRAHTDLREHLEATPAQLMLGVDYVLHAILDFVADGYGPVIEGIEEEAVAMEKRALDAFLSRQEVTRIFKMRRELNKFERVLGPMEEVAKFLQHHELPCIDTNVRPYFRDVADHIRRMTSLTQGLREGLATVFEASNLLEQQRQVSTTRRLAAWAAILAIPTAVAGIYGMNFDFMPELNWKYGYFVVIGVIVALCLYFYGSFKRAGWL